MDTKIENESTNLHSDLQSLTDLVKVVAKNYQGDAAAILAILRTLENLHQEVREGEIQKTLPDNRQELYNLLKDIESKGGWPYIPRLKLQHLLENWSDDI